MVKSTHLNRFNERQLRVSLFYPILRHRANDPEPDFKIRVHIKTRTGDLNVGVPLRFGDGQLYELLSGICDVLRFALLLEVDFRSWNEETEPHERYQLQLLVLLTSSNNFAGCLVHFLKIEEVAVIFARHLDPQRLSTKNVVIRIAVNGYTYLSKYRCISQY